MASSSRMVLVGRDEELRLLAAAAVAAAGGTPGFVLLAGEAGIGKTRLLDESERFGAEHGLRVLRGVGVDGAQGIAYLPLAGALRACLAEGPGATVVSELLESGAADAGPQAGDAWGARLLEDIYGLLTARPTLLLADDLHWADASTLMLLDFVSQRARGDPLLVIAAARSDEPGPTGGLRIDDGRRFTRVDLRRLTRDEVSDQLHALLGWPPHDLLVDRVHARSAGNPFFVEQVASAGSDGIPATLSALLSRRLASLDDGATQVLTALAVLGGEADEHRLALVAGVPSPATERALAAAERSGIVVPGRAGYDFRHPLYRELVVERASPGLRRETHRAAAELLTADNAPSAAIARHWDGAGDEARTFAVSLAAAGDAEKAFAFPEALIHLGRALELWAGDGRSEAFLRAARAAWYAGDPQRALALARDAEALDSDDVELQIALAAYAWDAGDRGLAREAFERASDLVRDDDPPALRTRGLWARARARTAAGRFREGREAALEAGAVAQVASLHWSEAQALLAGAMMAALDGRVDETTIAELRAGLLLAREVGSPETTGHAYQFLVEQLCLAGCDDEGLAVALEGIETCERLGLARSHASDLRGRAALVLIAHGRWEEAASILQQALPRGFPSLARGILAARQGRYDDAAAALAEADEGDAIGGPGSLGGEQQLARAELAWFGGDLAAMQAELDAMPPQPGAWRAPAQSRRASLAARLAADGRGRAVASPPREDDAGNLVDHGLGRALALELAAELARGAGAGSAGAWADAAAAWAALGRPFEHVYACAREAEALFGAASREAGRTALRAARDGAAELGAAPLVELVDDIARRARVVTAPRARTTDPDAPTVRELEVLALLDSGLTNKEIAERLFLSHKTVGIHVSRLLRKLDARTRGEAVAQARRRGLLA